MKDLHEMFTKVLKKGTSNVNASSNAAADLRNTAGEEMAIKEVEKKHMREILLKLMRLS
jgi:hypothetical protein